MTEAEWLAATDPGQMFAHLRDRGGASERKLRLFGVACCRAIWEHFDERCRRAVEVSERYADGRASPAELDEAQVATISGPADRDWGMRTLTLADPGGHTWEITQALPSARGSS